MRLATPEDYRAGCIYTAYPPPPEVYARRARLFEHWPEPILVVGCGFGGLVQAFVDLNLQAWGMEASPWMLEHRLTTRVTYGDILNPVTWTQRDFATLITEDLLPCLTDNETLIAAQNCRALSPITIHLVTEQGQAQELNYHSTAEWMALTRQPTISLEGM